MTKQNDLFGDELTGVLLSLSEIQDIWDMYDMHGLDLGFIRTVLTRKDVQESLRGRKFMYLIRNLPGNTEQKRIAAALHGTGLKVGYEQRVSTKRIRFIRRIKCKPG